MRSRRARRRVEQLLQVDGLRTAGWVLAWPIATFEELAQRLKELERVDEELGLEDPEQSQQRKELAALVERGRTAAQLDRLLQQPPGRN